MADGVPLRESLDPDFPEKGAEPPAESLEDIIASLARSREDVAAGRVVEGEVVLAEVRAVIGEYEADQADGAALRGG